MRHPDPDLRIEQYDPAAMAEPLWTSFIELNEQRFRESFPDDPLPARELKRRYMVTPHPNWEILWWRVARPSVSSKETGSSDGS